MIMKINGKRKRICFAQYAVLLLFAVGMCTGCGEKQPEGLPELSPCTITITQEGSPLAQATVLLIPQDPSLKDWSMGGTTDANGKALIRTHGQYNGIPVGEYIVVVNKEERTDDPKANSKAVKDPDYVAPKVLFSLVETKYNNPGTTPLKFKMEKETGSATFEVGKKVRVKFKQDAI
ncbi:MAG: carboxypeptidase regulatory-like domain-containing protein [Planctomycetia bacterium]|nr:carboxypeptidase regulatory-like domain-containing protein [Planctomycetia bacterium]